VQEYTASFVVPSRPVMTSNERMLTQRNNREGIKNQSLFYELPLDPQKDLLLQKENNCFYLNVNALEKSILEWSNLTRIKEFS